MGDLTPLSEIMKDFLKDLESGKAAEDFVHDEKLFRRGYHHGYDKAVEDIFRMLNSEHMSRKEVYKLSALQTNLIGVWRTELDGPMEPPEFHKANLLETLEHRKRPQIEEEGDYEEEGD